MRRALIVSVVLVAACGVRAGSGATSTPRAVVPWIDAQWSRSPPPAQTLPPTPTDVRLCKASDLVIRERGTSGATGWWFQLFGVGNRSRTPCLLRGSPGVRLVGSDGRPFREVKGNHASRNPKGIQNWVVLAPGLGDVPSGDAPLHPGQAGFSFQTYGACERPVLERYEFVLPWASTPIVLRVDPPRPFRGGRCDVPGSSLQMAVWPFAPVPTPAPPTPRPPPLIVTLEVPATAVAGSTLEYLVTLTNLGSDDVHFPECPYYVHWLVPARSPMMTTDAKGNPDGIRPLDPPIAGKNTLLLNCAPVRTLLLGASATFAMRLEVLVAAEQGPASLQWSVGGCCGQPGASATLTITRP